MRVGKGLGAIRGTHVELVVDLDHRCVRAGAQALDLTRDDVEYRPVSFSSRLDLRHPEDSPRGG